VLRRPASRPLDPSASALQPGDPSLEDALHEGLVGHAARAAWRFTRPSSSGATRNDTATALGRAANKLADVCVEVRIGHVVERSSVRDLVIRDGEGNELRERVTRADQQVPTGRVVE
jgi:hypothetical protein